MRTGKARLQLPASGPSSARARCPAAQAAYAAGQQNALWRFAALTYLNQGPETAGVVHPRAGALARRGVDLDIARFDRDRAVPRPDPPSKKVNRVATARSFPGTPTIQLAGPAGTTTVDATYDAIAAGVQKASGTAG